MRREIYFNWFVFIEVADSHPEFHSKEVPSQLFFYKSSTSSYGSFLNLGLNTFQNLKISKARKMSQLSVKERVSN